MINLAFSSIVSISARFSNFIVITHTMKKQTYIYKVSFDTPPLDDDKTDFYFSSLAAIYEQFTAKQIGCGAGHLYNIGVSDGNIYCGKKTHIERVPLTSKAKANPHSAKMDKKKTEL